MSIYKILKKADIICFTVILLLVSCALEPKRGGRDNKSAAGIMSERVSAEERRERFRPGARSEKISGSDRRPLPENSGALKLAEESGCLVCHDLNKTVFGPPWKAVAERYRTEAGARDFLIRKVRQGGRGNWTEVTSGLAMPAYERVSLETIGQIVDFILSLEE